MCQTDHLPEAEALLLDALRAAAHAAHPRRGAEIVLAARSAAAAAPAIVAMAAGAPSAWHQPLCPAIGEDEALLMAAIALAQRRARQEALALLCRMLPPIDAYRATSQAIAIGTAFRLAGLSLCCPWRSGAVPGFRA
jgi:hypothetical protein